MNDRRMAYENGSVMRENEPWAIGAGRSIRHDCRYQNYTGGGISATIDASYYKGPGARNGKEREFLAVETDAKRKYIVRRLTPLEVTRLQGFPDNWSDIQHYDDISDEEQAFWEKIRKQHAETYGKAYKPFKTKEQMIKWLNGLRTDSAEYRAYGNSVAIPCVEFVMGGIADLVRKEGLDNAEI